VIAESGRTRDQNTVMVAEGPGVRVNAADRGRAVASRNLAVAEIVKTLAGRAGAANQCDTILKTIGADAGAVPRLQITITATAAQESRAATTTGNTVTADANITAEVGCSAAVWVAIPVVAIVAEDLEAITVTTKILGATLVTLEKIIKTARHVTAGATTGSIGAVGMKVGGTV
jgi:hypothetical protein